MPRLVRLGAASVLGGITGAVLLLVLPPAAFQAIVPVLIALGCLLVVFQPMISRRVAARAEARGIERPEHGASWVWLLVFVAGVYGGYFGAAQGVLLMAVLGVGLTEIDAAQQRDQERARHAGQPGGRGGVRPGRPRGLTRSPP